MGPCMWALREDLEAPSQGEEQVGLGCQVLKWGRRHDAPWCDAAGHDMRATSNESFYCVKMQLDTRMSTMQQWQVGVAYMHR
jgi:hypothetical protein